MVQTKGLSTKLAIALAVIAGAVSFWQIALGDYSRAGCWMLIVLYWVVLTVKNIADAAKTKTGKDDKNG